MTTSAGPLVTREVGYRTPGGTTLLADVSIALKPGRVLAVVGPNGAGKTTLLRLLSSELAPSTGAILLNDRPLDHWTVAERARRLAVLPQQSTLNAALTGLEVTLLGRSPHAARGGVGGGAGRGPAPAPAAPLMDAAHLAARLYPSLTGGEKSRVQAARALAQVLEPDLADARFLLLDEPTAALDYAHQHGTLARVGEVAHTRGIGVVAILHDLNLAAQYADELLVLERVRVAAYGATREVFGADLLSAVFGWPMLVLPHPRHSWPMVIPG